MAKIDDDDEDLVGRGGDGRRTSKGDNRSGVGRDQLKSFVERLERLEEEKKTITDDIKDVYSEVKSTGFEVKAVRKIIAERKQDAAERLEFESIMDVYRAALGMIGHDAEDE